MLFELCCFEGLVIGPHKLEDYRWYVSDVDYKIEKVI